MIPSRIYRKLHLYRRSWPQASLVILAVCLAVTLAAASFQRHSAHKLRATAVLELTIDASGKVSSRIIPVAILDNGRFHDASIYESKPRPMALANGVIYEAQKSGVPAGYVTIYAGEKALGSWIAAGSWQSVTQAASAPPPPSPSQSPAASGDDRPILHRGGAGQPDASTQQNPTSSDSGPGNDRPVLQRKGPGDSQPPPQTDAPQTSSTEEGQADPNRPVLRRRAPGAEQSSTSTQAPAPATPPSSAPPQTIPPRPVVAANPGTQILVAVSDAQATDTRSFEYPWKPEEQRQVEAKMRKLALAQLPNENAQLNEHALTNVIVRSFDVDLSNEAVVVLQAEVPGGYLARGTKAAPGKFISRYITLIARMDAEGNPQRLAASVTDSSQLDIAPRLEFIDAVDVDGDGLAELLFRETGADQRSYIIYGVGHGTVTKVFEGASQSLR